MMRPCEAVKEAPVSRVTWKSAVAFPRYIDFRSQPCLTSSSISRTRASRRGGIEWERPYTLSWRSAMADDAEWMSAKSRSRLAPVLIKASSWTWDRHAQHNRDAEDLIQQAGEHAHLSILEPFDATTSGICMSTLFKPCDRYSRMGRI
jgi:hypothetical protein